MKPARLTAGLAAALVVLGSPLAGATAGAEGEVVTARVAGADRYATAAEVARAAFPDGAGTALLARGDAFPDALAGSFLAGAAGGPVLLTARDALSSAAGAALDDLGVGTVSVLGGTGAVSSAVAAELEAEGYTVERVAGENRYATAAAVAGAAGDVGELDGLPTAIIASGADFPDALAAGPLAYAGGFPILLTPPDALAPETEDALGDLAIGHVLVMGGTAAVSDAAVAAIEATGATTERVAGANRAATAAAAADLAVDRLGWEGDAVLLARSDAFPDGLAAGPFGGELGAPVLLTEPASLSPDSATWLSARGGTVATITAIGGTSAVADNVLAAAAEAASGASGTAGAYAVDGDRSLVAIGASRTCTVSAGRGRVLDLRLVPSALVTLADGLAPVFADDPPDGLADLGAPRAVITAVDGRALSPATAAANGVTSDGSVEVTFSSAEYDAVVLVAFTDAEGEPDHALAVDDAGAATEEAAAGCRTVFAPADAPLGTHPATTVGSVDPAEGLFIDAGRTKTFQFDDGDTFALRDTTLDLAGFVAMLSAGDVVDVDYAPGASGVSLFKVTDDTFVGASELAVIVGSLDGGATANDVQVSFTVPPSNGAGTRYRVRRAPTATSGDGCTRTIVATESTVVTTTSSPVDDLNVSDQGACFMYRVLTVNWDGLTETTGYAAPVKVPGQPAARDTVRPLSKYAAVTTGASPLGAGDTVTIAFDEPMAAPAAGASVTVTSGGTSATFTAGSGSSFSLNSSVVSVGGEDRPANTVLTITITTDPPTPVPLPATITNHSGIADAAGNLWDIAASSDRNLEAPA